MQTTPRMKIDAYTQKGWWGETSLNDLAANAAASAPGAIALIDPPNRGELVGGAPLRLSFGEIDEMAARIGCAFYAAGLREGDKIVVQMPNVAEIVLVYLAAARLGLIVSPVAMQYGRFELENVAAVLRPRAYVSVARFKGAPFGSENAGYFDSNCTSLLFGNGDFSFGQDINAAQPEFTSYQDEITADANSIFTICWTSGTTGRPKGVPRSHNHWLSSTYATMDAIRLEEGEVMLNPFPFINMAAIGGFLYLWLLKKPVMALHHPFDPAVFLQQLQNEKVIYTIAPPAILNMLLQQKDTLLKAFDVSSLRTIVSGSAPLSPKMVKGFTEEFGVEIVNAFGSNEGMSFVSCAKDVPDPEARAIYFPRFGWTGYDGGNRSGRQMTSKLVDSQSGETITAPGRAGEMLITGPTVFDGYFESPEDNAAAFSDDGYFRSGDLFEIAGDNNEFYRFVGRCKDIIVRGGVNISPEELDIILQAHPDIIEGAVCSYPDDVMGERVALVAVAGLDGSLDLASVNGFLEQRGVAKFKWPEKLAIVEALPRNAMNKVVRSSLREFL